MVGAVRGLQRLGVAPRAAASSCSRSSRRSAPATARWPACSPATRPTPRSSPSRRRAPSGRPRSASCGSRCACSARPRTPATRRRAPTRSRRRYAVIEALRALEAELNVVKPPLYAAYPHPINLNVGMIRGGDWPSTVAGECLTHCRLATLPGRADRRPEGARRADRRRRRGAPGAERYRVEVLYDGFQCEGYELAARRAAGHRPARRVRARDRRSARRCSRRRRRPTRARSISTATRPRSASARSPRTSTASTSACTCPRSPRPRRRSRCSSPTGAGCAAPRLTNAPILA